MKALKIILVAALSVVLFACSEDKMDEINKERNNALDVASKSIIPDAIVKSAFETTGTDIAWYATVYIEHSAGTWAQSVSADKRIGQNDYSLFNNNWNSLYDVLNELRVILDKTSPEGSEPENYWARGIAQVLTAYNLAMATDMWGEIPWTEALQGAGNLQPKYDKQSVIYQEIFALLDDAIVNLGKTDEKFPSSDYIYAGDQDKWIKAAYSLKARYHMRLSKRDNQAADKALAAIANGFAGPEDNFVFAKYAATASGENPWYQFKNDRTHLSAGQTLYDLMTSRNDPRIAVYFTKIDDEYVPAPNGTAGQNQGGVYSTSLITENGQTYPTPMMTFHEMKFIEAEAKFMKGDPTWNIALGEAIGYNFAFHGIGEGAQDYILNEVLPLLTPGNEHKEIMTQKYIALYEQEAIECYNDYRRTGFPTMNNPNNQTVGFVNRFPFAISEISSNSANVPDIDVYVNKVWWAGGDELVK